MSQVKWVDTNSLKDNAGKCDCDVGSTGPVPVVPLAALREVVEGLDAVEYKNMSDDFQAGQHNAFQRLLASLGKVGE